ncbi:MAG: ROK family protein [Firmicutes bacterium]|nr:ROK family protein [Bacillota bacterium]
MKVLALDIGGTFIKCAIMNDQAELLEQWKVPSDTSSMDALMGSLDSIIAPKIDEVVGVAISMPGKIDAKKGIAHTGGAFSFIKDWPVAAVLEEKYGKPVAVDNDGKCAANAEVWVGALKDVDNGLVYVIGTGIGGGVVINKKVHRGNHFCAGELSCCVSNVENKEFTPGNFMAVGYATPGLVKAYEAQTGEAVDGVKFFEKVSAGDEIAKATLEKFAEVTAKYFYNLQIVLDVDRICIGGGISAAPALLDAIRAAYHEIYTLPYPLPCEEAEIVRCAFGNDANLIGAVKHFLDNKI